MSGLAVGKSAFEEFGGFRILRLDTGCIAAPSMNRSVRIDCEGGGPGRVT